MVKFASILCAGSFFLNSALHLLLAIGLPFGQFVFGGVHTVFPLKLRLASGFFCLLWLFFGMTYLVFGKLIKIESNKSFVNIKIVAVTVFLLLATIFNLFISTSFFEKYITGGLSALTFALSLFLIWNDRRQESV